MKKYYFTRLRQLQCWDTTCCNNFCLDVQSCMALDAEFYLAFINIRNNTLPKLTPYKVIPVHQLLTSCNESSMRQLPKNRPAMAHVHFHMLFQPISAARLDQQSFASLYPTRRSKPSIRSQPVAQARTCHHCQSQQRDCHKRPAMQQQHLSTDNFDGRRQRKSLQRGMGMLVQQPGCE